MNQNRLILKDMILLYFKNFKEAAKTDSDYAALLQAEYFHCSSHMKEIKNKALSVYKIGCNRNHRLNYTCCGFKKLEERYLEYKTK